MHWQPTQLSIHPAIGKIMYRRGSIFTKFGPEVTSCLSLGRGKLFREQTLIFILDIKGIRTRILALGMAVSIVNYSAFSGRYTGK